MKQFLIDKLESELETCEILMNDINLDDETVKKYSERYFQIIDRLAELNKISNEDDNSKKELLIKALGVGVSAFSALTGVLMIIYDRKWSRNMIYELTNWEKNNTFTSSAGKMFSKNILPKKI